MNKEIWKNIPNYEGLYQISNYGRVKRLARDIEYLNSNQYGAIFVSKYHLNEKIISLVKKENWYTSVVLRKNNKSKIFKLHRLVAQAFLDNYSNDLEVNHINGIKDDNRVENLEMCTHIQNMEHSIKNGLRKTKKVNQYDLNGNFIKKWNSIAEAQKHYKQNGKHLYKVVGTSKTFFGYKWEYAKF